MKRKFLIQFACGSFRTTEHAVRFAGSPANFAAFATRFTEREAHLFAAFAPGSRVLEIVEESGPYSAESLINTPDFLAAA